MTSIDAEYSDDTILGDVESNDEFDEPDDSPPDPLHKALFARALMTMLTLCRLCGNVLCGWRRPKVKYADDQLSAELLRDQNAALAIQRMFRKRRTVRYYSAMKQAALRCSSSTIPLRASTLSVGDSSLRQSVGVPILETLDLCVDVPTPRPDAGPAWQIPSGVAEVDVDSILIELLGCNISESGEATAPIAEAADLLSMDIESTTSATAKPAASKPAALSNSLHHRAVATALRSRLLESADSVTRSGSSSGSLSPAPGLSSVSFNLSSSGSSSSYSTHNSALNKSVGDDEVSGRPRASSFPPVFGMSAGARDNHGGRLPMRWMSMSAVPDSRLRHGKQSPPPLTRSTADLLDDESDSPIASRAPGH